MKGVIIVLCLVFLAGCATTMKKPDAVTDTQYKADMAECIHEAHVAGTLDRLLWSPEKRYKQCLEKRGYVFE